MFVRKTTVVSFSVSLRFLKAHENVFLDQIIFTLFVYFQTKNVLSDAFMFLQRTTLIGFHHKKITL